jgi:transposase, IS5 family
MIVDRYDPVNLFELVPTKLRLEMEPELSQLDRLLEDDELFLRIKADFSKRRPNSERLGRRSTPVEVILRMLVLRRLYDWSFEATERNVSDSLVLRQFTRLYLEPAPDDTTLIRWANLIGPQTLERLNERVVALACQRKLTRGRKLRTVFSSALAMRIWQRRKVKASVEDAEPPSRSHARRHSKDARR